MTASSKMIPMSAIWNHDDCWFRYCFLSCRHKKGTWDASGFINRLVLYRLIYLGREASALWLILFSSRYILDITGAWLIMSIEKMQFDPPSFLLRSFPSFFPPQLVKAHTPNTCGSQRSQSKAHRMKIGINSQKSLICIQYGFPIILAI